jgi:hypothetical protein
MGIITKIILMILWFVVASEVNGRCKKSLIPTAIKGVCFSPVSSTKTIIFSLS